ncbi:hypothetical protein ACFV90_40855, partial [Streptomyces sp. NPDC059904]|uniref:hypothetical protein n=1 Tax=Streptomyces sp. NPDC059904 TaxID=3346996 RepID=UPI00366274A6
MYILAAAHTAHATAPDQEHVGWLGTIWNWTADHIPGGNLSILGVLVILGFFAKGTSRKNQVFSTTADWNRANRGFLRVVASVVVDLFKALGSLARGLWAVLRFYGGRELRGEPRSNATFFRAGTLTTPVMAPAVSMESVALAPPKVSLVKPVRRQPSPWAQHTATWLKTYRGRGATALDRTVRAALWTARAAGKLWRAR